MNMDQDFEPVIMDYFRKRNTPPLNAETMHAWNYGHQNSFILNMSVDKDSGDPRYRSLRPLRFSAAYSAIYHLFAGKEEVFKSSDQHKPIESCGSSSHSQDSANLSFYSTSDQKMSDDDVISVDRITVIIHEDDEENEQDPKDEWVSGTSRSKQFSFEGLFRKINVFHSIKVVLSSRGAEDDLCSGNTFVEDKIYNVQGAEARCQSSQEMEWKDPIPSDDDNIPAARLPSNSVNIRSLFQRVGGLRKKFFSPMTRTK